MKIFATSKIKGIDSYTINNEPIASVDLMERAAVECANRISGLIKANEPVIIFAGPGNNGGDAWAIARLLIDRKFSNIKLYLLKISDKISPDSEINRQRLIKQGKTKIYEINSNSGFPVIQNKDWVIDGLFGSGLSRPAEGMAADLIHHINDSQARVISIDIPSGLFGEDNSSNRLDNIVKAKYTLTFQFPKQSFFYTENYEYTGEWDVLPIGLHPGIIDKLPSSFHYITAEEIGEKIKSRSKFSHKGTYGHALLIAGSYGMMGAAVLAAKACLRSGVGLVTAHVPRLGLSVIQTAVPESTTSLDDSDTMFTGFSDLEKYDAVAVGPAISRHKDTQKAFKALLGSVKHPLVIDADGLNILGENKEWLGLIPPNSILTPHPREFERFAGKCKNGYERNVKQIELAQQLGIYIVLKGANTSVAFPDGSCYFNTTGNPGMATGGSGDVLTGILLSLLAQGYSSEDTTLMGVFIHGLAGDIAAGKFGEYSIIPSDIIDSLGEAFIKLTNIKRNG